MTKNDDPGGPVAARSHFPKKRSWGVVLGAKMARSWSVTTYVTEIVVGKPTLEL